MKMFLHLKCIYKGFCSSLCYVHMLGKQNCGVKYSPENITVNNFKLLKNNRETVTVN